MDLLTAKVQIGIRLLIPDPKAHQKVQSADNAVRGLILLAETVKRIPRYDQLRNKFTLDLFHMSLINTLHHLQHLCRALPS